MKRFALLLPALLFPYGIAFVMYCIFSGFLMERVFRNNAFVCLLFLGVFWIAALACTVLFCAAVRAQPPAGLELARASVRLQLIQIPAYLAIFLLGLLCMFTIFTAAISAVLLLLDGMSLALSGLVGVHAVRRCRAERILTAKESAFAAAFQFVFCANVVCSVLLFFRAKHKEIPTEAA